jgi:hypothetical protein
MSLILFNLLLKYIMKLKLIKIKKFFLTRDIYHPVLLYMNDPHFVEDN